MRLKLILKPLTILSVVSTPFISLSACGGGKSEVKVTSISISSSANTVYVGKTAQFIANVGPSDATNKTISWVSSNTTVGTINSNGSFSALAEGQTEIYAKATDGSSVTSNKITITVKVKKIDSITFPSAVTVLEGGNTTPIVSISPIDASNKKLHWEVGDTSIATVNENTGLITGVKKGSTTLKATATDGSGKTASTTLTVTEVIVPITSITLNDVLVKTSETAQCVYTIAPTNATNKTLEWSSSDTSIATVDQTGLVSGVKDGHVTITAKATDGSGKQATANVVVYSNSPVTETYEEYIYNRTFSLQGIGNDSKYQYMSWGTGWILADATPDKYDDFKYYIVTNQHVIKGQENLKAKTGSTYKIQYGCGNSSYLSTNSDYLDFTSYEPVDISYSTYNNSDTIATEEYDEETGKLVTRTGLKGCDIHVVLADFSSCVSSSTTAGKIAKEKLTKLNTFTQAGQKITQLAPTASSSSNYANYPLYSGGYPANLHSGSKHPTWEVHDLTAESVTVSYYDTQEYTHWCDSTSAPLTDCTAQYKYNKSSMLKNWLRGGASGSMLLTNLGTESSPIWRIAGIYWGGLGYDTEDDSYIQPMWSVFNSDWKNYLQKWA